MYLSIALNRKFRCFDFSRVSKCSEISFVLVYSIFASKIMDLFAVFFINIIYTQVGFNLKVLTTLPMTIYRPFFLNLKISRTKIGNLKWQIERDINPVTFAKFVTSLVQKLKILGFYKNCKSSYWLQVSFLPPTMKLHQGNVFTPVCHSVHIGVSVTPLGRQPLGRHPLDRHPLDRHPLGRHPWADIPLGRPPGQTPPWADTPTFWADTPPLGRHPPAQYMLGCGQQAGGMHPTGMHSCYLIS